MGMIRDAEKAYLGSWIADTGSHIPDTGSHIPDTGSHIPDTGFHIPDTGSHIPVTGSRNPDPDLQHWLLDRSLLYVLLETAHV